MPKFFVTQDQIREEEITIVGKDVNHITNVLRMNKGDRVNICDISSKNNYIAEIFDINIGMNISCSQEYVKCKIIEKLESNSEPNVYINIFQGLPKADKMELIIQKNVEIGASEITPVKMKRCVVKLDDKSKEKKIDRWQKIAEMAAKQSGRDYIPKVNSVIGLKSICNLIKDYDIVLLAYEEEKENTLKSELKYVWTGSLNSQNRRKCTSLRIGIIIGPEGGMEKEEVESLKESGAKVITLGKRILRTETARVGCFFNYNV